VRLAKCLIDEVDIMLLDEPTNHLDYQSVKDLEGVVRRWHGPVVVVSHDRAFLDAVCTHIADIRYGGVETYTGNYTAYMQERSIRMERQLQDFKLQERKRKAMEVWLHKLRERASYYASPRR
jgi:ATP-binding cassette subfamily F protein 3